MSRRTRIGITDKNLNNDDWESRFYYMCRSITIRPFTRNDAIDTVCDKCDYRFKCWTENPNVVKDDNQSNL